MPQLSQYSSFPIPTYTGQGPQPQQQTYTPTNYLNSLPMPQNSNKTVVEPMDEPALSFEKAFNSELRKELQKDYVAVTRMTLLDDPDIMYNLFRNRPAFTTDKFLSSLLATYYREKYSELFKKYDSLSVYIEFVLSTIIHKSESGLKSACTSRAVRLPNSGASDEFLQTFGCKKRGAPAVGMLMQPAKKSKGIHPFLSTPEYQAKPILFEIGKCCKYAIPSQFAELFAQVQYDNITRFMASSKQIEKGLKVVFSKSIVCMMVQKKINTASMQLIYMLLEHFKALGDIFAGMTNLTTLDDSFALGSKKNMKIENISLNKIEVLNDKHDGCIAVIIDGLGVNKMSNNTLSAKTYSDIVYMLPENNMSESEIQNCQQYINTSLETTDAIMDKYDEDLAAFAEPSTPVASVAPVASVSSVASVAPVAPVADDANNN